MRSSICRTLVTVLSLLVASCGAGAVTPSPSANVAGAWSGVIGQGSGGGRALRLTWTATQDGLTATGPAAVITSPPVTDVIFSGILTGRIAGSDVALTLSAQPLPGSECVLTGTGSATLGTGTLTGTLDVHFTGCGALEPPANDHIVLTRQ